MSDGAKFVVAAYAVIWILLLFYVIVVAARTQRMSREIELLGRLVERTEPEA